jgi:hypothetical protein
MRVPLHTVAVLGILVGALNGCGDAFGPGRVEVRVENASAVRYDEATLYTLDGPRTYSDLAPGARSPYVSVSSAYRSATTQVVLDGDTLRLQVIDYVGEEPLDAGRYTYVLSVFGVGTARPVLRQVLRQDD